MAILDQYMIFIHTRHIRSERYSVHVIKKNSTSKRSIQTWKLHM